MRFRNLIRTGCAIALSLVIVPVIAQNLNAQSPDTTKISYGYGLESKKSVTGAVTTATPETFNQGAIFNPVDQLSGKVAGLTITEPGGDPNQNAQISIRGQSSLLGNLLPLFVVDGVILDDASEFQSIPPDEITSYTVLKDASATAIYGVRGSNGVIIVTTQKGAAGKISISYDGLVGAAAQSKYYDLLNAHEYLNAISSIPNIDASVYNKGANTDWQKAIGRTAIQDRNSLSVSGGSNIFTFLGAVDYQDQDGIVQNNGKEQLGLRFNAELKPFGDKLDIKAGIQNVNTTRKLANYYNFTFVPNAPPSYPVKNADGSYYEFSDFNLENPAERFNEETFGDKEHLNLVNGSIDYSIIDGLKIGVLASADLNKINGSGFIPTFPIDRNASLSGTSDEDAHTYNANAHISYDKTLGKNTVNLLAAYEYNSYAFNSDYANTSAGSTSSGTFKEDYKLKSFIARAAYSYDERFYLAATLRKDNSTAAAPIDQPGTYPSVSLAYRFKKDLLANVDWISDIKLKAGYGVTGNSLYLNGIPSSLSEQTDGTNIGLEFSLLNGRISGDVNYFNDQSKNLTLSFITPNGPNGPTTGSLTNKGLEIALSGRIISGRKLNWTAYGQITFISTALSSQFDYLIPQGEAQGRGLSSSPITFLKTGYNPYVFYLPHYTGTDAQGNQTFDGKTIAQNPDPQSYYIDPAPKFNYGITNSFDYGNWNVSFALRGVYGQKIFNNTLLDIQTSTRLPGNNVTKEALTNGIKDAPVASDLWLEGASYLRMDNMMLAYSFRNVSFASELRVFISANNLFVITGYKGLDPEIQITPRTGGNLLLGENLNGSANQPYIDANYNGQGYYPIARTFSVGVNVTLK